MYTFGFFNCWLRFTRIDTGLCYKVPFPEGYGATVHLFWPGKGFQLLGMLVLFASPLMNPRLDLDQAFKRKTLRDLSFAWELRVPIFGLSSGLLKSSTACARYRCDRGAWHLRRASSTGLGASQRFTRCRVQTRTRLVRRDGIC